MLDSDAVYSARNPLDRTDMPDMKAAQPYCIPCGMQGYALAPQITTSTKNNQGCAVFPHRRSPWKYKRSQRSDAVEHSESGYKVADADL